MLFKKIVKGLLIGLIIVVILFTAFITIFALIPNQREVKADSIEIQEKLTFTGSDFNLPNAFAFNRDLNNPGFIGYLEYYTRFNFTLSNDSSSDNILITSNYYNSKVPNIASDNVFAYNEVDFTTTIRLAPDSSVGEFDLVDTNMYGLFDPLNSSYDILYGTGAPLFWISYSQGIFNNRALDFDMIMIGSVVAQHSGTSYSCNYICYRHYIETDNYARIYFIFPNVAQSTLDNYVSLTERIYYLKPTYYSSDSNVAFDNGYNDGYYNGYKDGYNTGSSESSEESYDRGYNVGKDDGYYLGFQEGSSGQLTAGNFFQRVLDILDIKIFGVISIGDILMISVGLMLVTMALKIFAGG